MYIYFYIYIYIYIYIYRHYAFAATFNPNNKNVFPLIQTVTIMRGNRMFQRH